VFASVTLGMVSLQVQMSGWYIARAHGIYGWINENAMEKKAFKKIKILNN